MTRPECRQKKPPPGYRRRFQVKRLAVSYSRMAAATLSSALSVFTSEFEKGSGGLVVKPAGPIAAGELIRYRTSRFDLKET